MSLPIIPFYENSQGRLGLIKADPTRMNEILNVCYKTYSRAGLRVGDWIAKPWLLKNNSPYKNEIMNIAAALDVTGVYALNASFEWGCTTSVTSQNMTRVLDWPLTIGDKVTVAQYRTPHGNYYDINWPGYVGVLNGVAPGRFAATINQAPMSYTFLPKGIGVAGDWLVNRARVWKNQDWLPSHLLRNVFEECADYESARQRLMHEKLCVPALFSLVGSQPGQHCVIERLEDDCIVHDAAGSVTNNWLNNRFQGRDRPVQSRARHVAMQACLGDIKTGDWDWLKAPIFNRQSVLVYQVDFENNVLKVQGLDGKIMAQVTEKLILPMQ